MIDKVQDSRQFQGYSVLQLPPGPELSQETSAWIVQGLERAMPSLNIREYFLAKGSTLSDCDFVIVAVERDSGQIISALTSRWHQEEGQRLEGAADGRRILADDGGALTLRLCRYQLQQALFTCKIRVEANWQTSLVIVKTARWLA